MKKRNLFNRLKQAFNPEKDTGEKRPVRVTVAKNDVYDKYSEYPSNGLNPLRLAHIFREADEGDVRRQMELFEEIEEKDTHLFSQLQTRKLAVTGLEWEVQPYSKEERDIQIAAFIDEQMKNFTNLSDIFMDMLDAIGKGISVSELNWGIDEFGHDVITGIEWIHPKKLIWDTMTDELKICTREYPTGLSIPKNKFVIHKYKAKSGHASRSGLLRIASWMYLFKNFDIKDWVAFLEVYGMPLRLGKYDASASDDDKAALLDAIMSLGSDAAGIISKNTDMEFVEANKTSSSDVYEKFTRYADEQMSKAILGQTLTSDSGGGSYAQGKVHSEVKHELTVADAKSLSETVRRDIISPLVEYNFGADQNIPFFTIDCQEPEDLKEDVEIYVSLSRDLGLTIPEGFIRKKFSIPEPKEGEKILSPVSKDPISEIDDGDSEEKQLKTIPNQTEQDQIDRMSEIAIANSKKIFEDMFQPLKKLVDEAENMEEIQAILKDNKKLKELYSDMNTGDLRDMVNQTMYLANAIGRVM